MCGKTYRAVTPARIARLTFAGMGACQSFWPSVGLESTGDLSTLRRTMLGVAKCACKLAETRRAVHWLEKEIARSSADRTVIGIRFRR